MYFQKRWRRRWRKKRKEKWKILFIDNGKKRKEIVFRWSFLVHFIHRVPTVWSNYQPRSHVSPTVDQPQSFNRCKAPTSTLGRRSHSLFPSPSILLETPQLNLSFHSRLFVVKHLSYVSIYVYIYIHTYICIYVFMYTKDRDTGLSRTLVTIVLSLLVWITGLEPKVYGHL